MLYHVRLQYGIHVDASSKSEAFKIACRDLRVNPGSLISAVKQPDESKGKTGIIKRLITGK